MNKPYVSVVVEEKKYDSIEEELNKTLQSFLFEKIDDMLFHDINSSILKVLYNWGCIEDLKGIKFECEWNEKDNSLIIKPYREMIQVNMEITKDGVKFYKCSICHDTGYEIVYGTNKGFPCMCCDTHEKEIQKVLYNYNLDELNNL